VPVPDDIKGEKPIAFVVRAPGASVSADEIKQHALANAPAYQHPRMVIFVDELPLAGPGKIDRKGLETRGRQIWQDKET
jgi:acyl-CoA synthetase (AMP-forming)/AMP-acid ligase II